MDCNPRFRVGQDSRVLVVGAGEYGAVHADAIMAAPGVRLAGIVDVDRRQADRLAHRLNVPAWSDLAAAMSHDAADLVAVVVPTFAHTEVALEAIRLGAHVLVEKPVCLDPADLERLSDAATRKNRLIDVVSQRRFQDGIYQLKQAVDDGVLGRISSSQCDTSVWRESSYFTSAPWRGAAERGGGNLLNHGMHALDLLLWFMGDLACATAYATPSRREGVTVEESLVSALRFTDGGLATLHASLVSYPGSRMTLTLTGEHGTAKISDGDAVLEYGEPAHGDVTVRSWTSHDSDAALSAQYQALAAAAATGAPLRVGLDHGGRALRAALSILASAQSNAA